MHIEELLSAASHESVTYFFNRNLRLHYFIAIHDTSNGPSLGGIRLFPYKSLSEACEDVLRLSEGMTNKAILAGLQLGGGKSVAYWERPDPEKRQEALEFIAECVASMGGRYIAAEDMGISEEDVGFMSKFILQKSEPGKFIPFVGLPENSPVRLGSGDPSPVTALGVLEGIKATLPFVFPLKPNLLGRNVTLQGAGGKVGKHLIQMLLGEGAILTLSDASEDAINKLKERYGTNRRVEIVPANESDTIYDRPCKIFIPCAIGSILHAQTITSLNAAGCKAIVGCANNQLRDESVHGYLLHRLKMIYAPDYVVNSGGLINVAQELSEDGYDRDVALEKVREIGPLLKEIFEIARRSNRPPYIIAKEMAEQKLAAIQVS